MATTLAVFSSLESDCTENRGLPDAQALLQLTAKLAQQANLSYCEIAPATNCPSYKLLQLQYNNVNIRSVSRFIVTLQ